jgi:prophage antirepressor-like protein
VPEHPIRRPRFHQGVLVFDYGTAKIRCGGTSDKPWFVAKDVCEVLGIANHNDAIGRLDDDEKGEVGITDPIGRKQLMAVVYESGLYALIFTSRKEEAKAFRKWVTSEVLPSIRKTGAYRLKERNRYLRQGKQLDWIEQREEGISVRNEFTGTLRGHGVCEGWEFGRITNTLYHPTLGGTAASVRRRLGIPEKASLRDHLPLRELYVVGLAELLAQQKIESENQQGFDNCHRVTAIAANNVADAVKRTDEAGRLPPGA